MNEQRNDCRKQPRNSAFDILRLVAMLMVTILHITGHGLQKAQIEPFSSVYWIAIFLNTFSLVAVNCFVLISGYFLSSQTISFRKLASLWLQVWIYSVTVYVLLCLLPRVNVEFRISTLIECMFPLLSNQYWFFTCYFLLYLLVPILNKLVQSWDQREYRNLLAVLLVVFSLIPSANIWGDSFGVNRGYSLVWFVLLYLIAGYIRRFGLRCPVHPGVVYLASCIALCAIRAAVTLWNTDISSVQVLLSNQCGYNGPLVLCASIGLFVWAGNAQPNTGRQITKIITAMASFSFGVYLLHDHSSIRTILWNDWVCLKDTTAHGGDFLLRILLVLMILFAAGLASEFIRRKIMAGIGRAFQRKTLSTGNNNHETTQQN